MIFTQRSILNRDRQLRSTWENSQYVGFKQGRVLSLKVGFAG